MVYIMQVLAGLPVASQSRTFGIMFYNTENFFDSADDSLTLDDEFTPAGAKHWTGRRFRQKAYHLYKVFIAAGEWDPPELIGLAEVENAYVLHFLTEETPFVKFDYGFVHYDSPDKRGIDVALLYRKKSVRILSSRAVPVTFPEDAGRKTRDILSVMLVAGEDTLVCFVNHWPSRRGGYLETMPYRLRAAQVLKQAVDSVRNIDPAGKIVVMGDFNDEPSDSSLLLVTGSTGLVNLMKPMYQQREGTLYYDRRWWLFDQFLISAGLAPTVEEAKIFRPLFLMERDNTTTPYRTYSGMRYLGGFSDHLPVLLHLNLR